ncbi:hypothetical protein B0G69_8013 [Paraburkholderia sp. RAU2J]|uniref:hypothetical protein n=1 Tax=Paraburkholderia sp. RAU2J TaxID=1938810 RepID=UPI000EB2C573|nr:hypothetical protein [Paraburkholderia sp. RAU2J]RKT10583.1 hypothetical protein B0G69_8013 [Paraburkholderia sp. RAU2J]
MSLTPFLIAKLSRVDLDLAQRALSTARAQDVMDESRPAEFTRGAGARAYGMALFISRRPAHFYLGMFGLILFPLYMMSRLLPVLIEWGAHAYGR